MNPEHCSRLDDYLNGDLREAERGAFESHLGDCESCRRVVGVDRHWEGLLAGAKPVVPAGLPDRITVATDSDRARRRSIQRSCALLGLAAGLMWVIVQRFAIQEAAPIVRQDVASPVARPATAPAVRIEFAPESQVIAMPLESKNPQVSIVWLYPEVRSTSPATESSAN